MLPGFSSKSDPGQDSNRGGGGYFYKKCQAANVTVDSRIRDSERIDAVKEAKERAVAYLSTHGRDGYASREGQNAWASGRLQPGGRLRRGVGASG